MESAIYADGRFYCLSQEGVTAIVAADRKGMRVISRFQLARGRRKDVWVHPVILDVRLYLHYHGTLQCHDMPSALSEGCPRIRRGTARPSPSIDRTVISRVWIMVYRRAVRVSFRTYFGCRSYSCCRANTCFSYPSCSTTCRSHNSRPTFSRC